MISTTIAWRTFHVQWNALTAHASGMCLSYLATSKTWWKDLNGSSSSVIQGKCGSVELWDATGHFNWWHDRGLQNNGRDILSVERQICIWVSLSDFIFRVLFNNDNNNDNVNKSNNNNSNSNRNSYDIMIIMIMIMIVIMMIMITTTITITITITLIITI